jgi:hypothetical protein
MKQLINNYGKNDVGSCHQISLIFSRRGMKLFLLFARKEKRYDSSSVMVEGFGFKSGNRNFVKS